ncbi:MAG TPA: hypothetical protein VFQ53_26775 [Kofleriaceae bacterium]|nr:hypothetical protein [Kofleriaceae bacterium]
MRLALLVIAVAACRRPEPAPDLTGELARIARLELDARRAAVAHWKLDEAAWRRIVVEPYRARYADYARAFDAAAPALAERLHAGTFAARAHFAGDPALTADQARTRWALPVAFAAEVATLDGQPIDAVFVDDHGVRAIVGVDAIVHAAVAARDPACARLLDTPEPAPRCREIQWELADTALREDAARFAHACALATTLCGKPSP